MSREELMGLTNVALRAMCKERGISYYRGKNTIKKDEMVDKLLEHEEAESPVVESDPIQEQPQEQEIIAEVVTRSEKPTKKVYISKRPTNPVISPDKHKEISATIASTSPVAHDANVGQPWVMGGKDDVIEKAEAGTLVAFLDNKGKPRSAKIINRSASRRMLKLVTEFGWEYVVSYDSVLWVKNGTKWPRAVYNMLKGYSHGQPVFVTRQPETD